jgi:NAD(P)-dependent dehydrogenase (short-subunit alcohol dehydrogenase family)
MSVDFYRARAADLTNSWYPDTASKGAVLAMTRELAMVHAREGIRLNSLCPCVVMVLRLLYLADVLCFFVSSGPLKTRE